MKHSWASGAGSAVGLGSLIGRGL